MSLAEGTTFTAYEITGVLGAGAMGKVYRAHDTRLDRDVALKILPAEFASNPDRRRRFEQESRASGALNHPNIVAVYEAGHQEGVSFIAYELVDGEALRDLINRGPVPIRKVLDLSAQIADGLAAAHSAGITHRDLKPENIMLTRDGRPKILDFGLARYEPKTGETAGTMTMTEPGTLLGTPGYMSPEQVLGKPADARSDIFSLGSIMYEMLTGKMAFERASVIEAMSAIIREEPAEMPSTVPAPVQSIVAHCMEKAPAQRYQSAQDLAFGLRAVSGSTIAPAPVLSPETAPVIPPPRLTTWLPVAAALLAIIAIFAVYGLVAAPQGTDLATYRFTPVASGAEPMLYPSWSPDGKSIAYRRAQVGAFDELMIRRLDSLVPISVAKTDFNFPPMWSTDGARLYFVTNNGVSAVSRAGGVQEQILKGDFAAAAISPDGKTLAVWRVEGGQTLPKVWISSPPGAPLQKYEPVVWNEEGSTQPIFMAFSPNGRQLAISRITGTGPEMWLLPFPSGTGKPKRILTSQVRIEPPGISWMPDSRHLVLSSRSRLWMADTATDSMMPLTAGEGPVRSAVVSPDGKGIAFDTLVSDFDLIEIPLDGSAIRPLLATSRNEVSPEWSRSGSQLAYVTNRGGSYEIWLRSELDGSERPVVTQHDFPGDETTVLNAVAMSPEGQRLAYLRGSSKSLAQIWVSPAGGGEPVRVSPDNDYAFGPTWSPDGNWLAYISAEHGLVKVQPGASAAPVTIFDNTCENPPRWSPDERFIVCVSESNQVILVSPDGKSSRRVGDQPAFFAAWSRDSSKLYALGKQMESPWKWRLGQIDPVSGAERILAELPPQILLQTNWGRSTTLSISPDGTRLATTQMKARSDIMLLEGFPQPRSFFARLWWPAH